jgi:predicted aspartyl protease
LVEAIIDTAFNGALTLPSKQINALGLPLAGQEPVTMADG